YTKEFIMERKIGLEIRTLNNSIKRHLDFSSHKNEIEKITGNNGWIIGYVGENIEKGKDIFQKDIEEHFDLTRSTVSNVLTKMEKKELIKRLPVEQDRRLRKIVLTPKAEKLQSLMKNDIDDMEALIVKDFSIDEIDQLHGYLERIKKNIS
ncbi:MAG: MarR family transcriptional regulator, partial [Spirochaetales bacterium]|nr:MarR family transcriptional regulator [Spirochaetales bacterium]